MTRLCTVPVPVHRPLRPRTVRKWHAATPPAPAWPINTPLFVVEKIPNAVGRVIFYDPVRTHESEGKTTIAASVPPSHQHHTSAGTSATSSGSPHPLAACITILQSPSMELEKRLAFTSFDEFKDHIQTWAVTKKLTPRVLKKDRYDGL
jgi:hypothetical protein